MNLTYHCICISDLLDLIVSRSLTDNRLQDTIRIYKCVRSVCNKKHYIHSLVLKDQIMCFVFQFFFVCSEFLGQLEESPRVSSSSSAIDVRDPISEQFYTAWRKTAHRNMEILEQVSN